MPTDPLRRGRTTLAATAALLVGLATGGGVAWNLRPEPPEPVRITVTETREVPADCPVVDCPTTDPPRCVAIAVHWGGVERHEVCADRVAWIADAVGMRLEDSR